MRASPPTTATATPKRARPHDRSKGPRPMLRPRAGRGPHVQVTDGPLAVSEDGVALNSHRLRGGDRDLGGRLGVHTPAAPPGCWPIPLPHGYEAIVCTPLR